MTDSEPARGTTETPSSPSPRVLVAACGNPSRGDDGFGPAVARVLSGSPDLEVVDLGMRPAALLDHLEDRDMLILVDAVRAPDTPAGTLLTIDWDDPGRPRLAHDDPLSSHGLSLGRQLELARALGHLPDRILLVGVAVTDTDLATPMTPATRAQIEPAATHIRHHARDTGASNGRRPSERPDRSTEPRTSAGTAPPSHHLGAPRKSAGDTRIPGRGP